MTTAVTFTVQKWTSAASAQRVWLLTHGVPAGICEFTDNCLAGDALCGLHLHCGAHLQGGEEEVGRSVKEHENAHNSA